MDEKPLKSEPESKRNVFTSAYVVYIGLTAAIFAIMLIIGYLGWQSGLVPKP